MDSYLAISLIFWIDYIRTAPFKFLAVVIVLLGLAMLITYLLICYYQYKRK